MIVPNPYESLHKLTAYYDRENNRFSLSGKTYHLKEKLKELNGKWDGKKWTVPLSAIHELKPLIMIRVVVDKHCHEDERETFVTHKEAICGYARMGCPRCDTPASCGDVVKILEVMDKDLMEIAKTI